TRGRSSRRERLERSSANRRIRIRESFSARSSRSTQRSCTRSPDHPRISSILRTVAASTHVVRAQCACAWHRTRSSSERTMGDASRAGCTARTRTCQMGVRNRSNVRRSGSPMKPDTTDGEVLVAVRDLKTYYSIRGGFAQRLLGREAGYVRAVDDVSLELRKGEVLGLVGESG